MARTHLHIPRSSIDKKIKTQSAASDAFNGRRAGAIGCRRKCRRGKARECGSDWETGSLLLAFVDLLLFLLALLSLLSLLLLLSLFPLTQLHLLLLLSPLFLFILLFLALSAALNSVAASASLHLLLLQFSMFLLHLLLTLLCLLPLLLLLSLLLLLPLLHLLPMLPLFLIIQSLDCTSLPVMRVLQQPRSRPPITKALTTCCSRRPTCLGSRSVSQSSSHARQLCVAAHANVANSVADCIIAVGSRQQQQQLATLATAQLVFKAAKVFVSVHFNLPVERSTKSNANQSHAK